MSRAALLDEGIATAHSEFQRSVPREGRVSMMRKWLAIPLAVSAVIVVTTSVSAQQVRGAKIGDHIASLVTGLVPINGGPLGSCAEGAPVVVYAQFLVPPRVDVPVFGPLGNHDGDNASVLGFFIGNRFVMLVAFDEQNPSVPLAVYADLDGNGLITSVWPVAQAPALCAIVQQLHYKP
jgi:hypothetical protein